MKTLIFALLFSTFSYAQDPGGTRLSDQEISNKLVSVARDIENQNILAGASELQSCRDDFQRTAAQKKDPNNEDALKALETCLGGKINASNAATLSDKLDLEAYKLIPSKTVQNVTKYLTKNLYRELTGVDIEEQDTAKKLQSMKFKTMKQVDQKVFFELYKNQIAKNVLFEVSRFCLMDFRNTNTAYASKTTFVEHWNFLNDFDGKTEFKTFPGVTDHSDVKFEDQNTGKTTPQTAQNGYQEIMRNVFNTNQIPDATKLGKFFFFCGQKMKELCEEREKKCATTSASGVTSCGDDGEKACLSKTRLIALRSALKDTDKVMQDLMTSGGSDISIALKPDQIIRRYSGVGNGEKSINELTNNASAAFYQANMNEDTQQATDCINNGKCENFEIIDDSVARIETNTNIEYLAKKKAELERVRDLVQKGGQPLRDYLDQYYPDLKDKANDRTLLDLIARRWDSQRTAMIQEIQGRIGSRQITSQAATEKSDNIPTITKREEAGRNNAIATLNEKTRLAQVVFFNNIISSSLDLQNTNHQSLGRNIQALNNEVDSAEELQPGLFTDLKSRLGTQNGGGAQLTGNEQVTNLEFLDNFIGIPKDPNQDPSRSLATQDAGIQSP